MITDIQSYAPNAGDSFFIDANVWLYFYSPIPDPKKDIIAAYTKFYSNIIRSGASVYTSSHVISEFINRYLRLDHDLHKSKYHEYKRDYRNSPEYYEAFNEVSSIVKNNIIGKCKRIDDQFSTLSIDDIFDKAVETDFVDSVIFHCVKDKKIPILTHDGDYKHFSKEVRIFTANYKLIKST